MVAFVVCVGVFAVLFRERLFPVSTIPSPLPATANLTLLSSPTELTTVLPPIIDQPTLIFTPTLIPSAIPSTTPTNVPTTVPTTVPTATPQLNTSIFIEAEDGEAGSGAYVLPEKTASEKLYVICPTGGTLKFKIRDFAAGQYNLLIHYVKYVNNTPDYRDPGYQYLYVNNNGPFTITYYKTMGDEVDGIWKWGDQSTNIYLEDGTNTLLIENGYPGVSIDYIYISK
jgi:hypothetical protein